MNSARTDAGRNILFRNFPGEAALTAALAARLIEEFTRTDRAMFAVMLAGGRTPLAAYREVAASGITASPGACVLFSDERMVTPNSTESNFGNARIMIDAMGIPMNRVIRVNRDLPLKEAAGRYDADLAQFFERGGQITFGLLGLGADGHTASLFTPEDIARGADRWAVAVPRQPHDRVSVAARVIAKVQDLVIAATGPDKKEIVARLLKEPGSTPAGMATCDNDRVQLWYA